MGTLNPLEIFPLEVWETIFEQLGGQPGSSINLLNCSNVCTKFDEILKPTQFQWLFESVCPLIFPYLEVGELLKCRRVCKEWCRVVDNFLENLDERVPFNEETTEINSSQVTISKGRCLWTRFTHTEEISEFMKLMNNVKNPFIGGSLHLEECEELDWSQNTFNEKASELLVMFGKHIKHIIVEPLTQTQNADQFYHLLSRYLHSLPNLRSFEVYGESGFYEYTTDFLGKCRRLRQLKMFLERESSSLPEIFSLESLKINAHRLPRCISEKLIDSINPCKLRCLKITLNKLSAEGNLTLKQPLPSLTELHLHEIRSYEQFEHLLTNLVSKEAPLGKLVLKFLSEYRFETSKINFDLVFEAISGFGKTLKMLTIEGFQSHDPITELPNPPLSMLNIPHLRSLEIDGVAFGPGFLPSNLANSLEYLRISLSHELASGTEFYKGALVGNLCHSPIWSEMPKLKVIKVLLKQGLVTCSREMHERGVVCKPRK